jgi:hypothetical protein
MWNVITVMGYPFASFSELFLGLLLFSRRSYLFYFNLLYLKSGVGLKKNLETG